MSATMSKKERKAMRKQMAKRKMELLAKHGRADRSATHKPNLPKWEPVQTTEEPAPRASRPEPVVTQTVPPKPSTPRKIIKRRVMPRSAAPAKPVATPVKPATRMVVTEAPGPLQRGAAVLEHGLAKAATLPGKAKELMKVEPDEPSAYGSVSTMVWPLRFCGLAATAGAVKLSVDAGAAGGMLTGMVTLGMGLGLAVMLLGLAELARAVWGLTRAQA